MEPILCAQWAVAWAQEPEGDPGNRAEWAAQVRMLLDPISSDSGEYCESTEPVPEILRLSKGWAWSGHQVQ